MTSPVTKLLSGLSVVLVTQGCSLWSGTPAQDIRALLTSSSPGMLAMSDYDRGKHYLAVGDYGLAIDSFGKAVAGDPKSVPAINGLAIAYDRIGRADVARSYFEMALQVDPRSADTLNNVAYLYLSHGNKTEAANYLAQAKQVLAQSTSYESRERLAEVIDRNAALATTPAPAPVQTASAEAEQPKAIEAVTSNLWNLYLDQAAERMQAVEAIRVSTRSDASANSNAADDTVIFKVPNDETAEGSKAIPAFDYKGVTVRIANGTGRHNMAHRFQDYLDSLGVPVKHLIDTQVFKSSRSKIYYSKGQGDAAQALAKLLPISVQTIELQNDYHAVELVLSSDLIEFDRSLASRADK